MDNQKTYSNSLFQNTLSKQTCNYIQSKLVLSDHPSQLSNLDLRDTCETVRQTATDYLHVQKNIMKLGSLLEQNDKTMSQLEEVLQGFKSHLQLIKKQMTNLQQKSVHLNNNLKNKKQIQKALSNFVQSAVIEPQLISNIHNKPINQEYVQYIKILNKKMKYIKNSKIQSAALKQIQPTIQALNQKACSRVRQFLLEKITLLKKPKTNIQIMQRNVLSKFRVFNQFLKQNFLSTYTQLCNNYRQIMARFYLTNYKTYLNDLNKLNVHFYTKNDLLLAQGLNMRKYLNQTKPTNYNQQNKSIFFLMNRQKILQETEDDTILYHIAAQKGAKYIPQHLFKSMNKIFLDSTLLQILFSSDFFTLKSQQAEQLFGQIFKPSINFMIDNWKNMCVNSFDIYTLLLISLINQKNRSYFNQQSLHLLDFYFDQVNMIVWPRFQQVFQNHYQSVKNTKNIRSVSKQLSYFQIINRICDFLQGCYICYSKFDQSRMLAVRINKLKQEFFELIRRSSQDLNEYEKVIMMIQSFYECLINFQRAEKNCNKKELKQDIQYLKGQINTLIDNLIKNLMLQHFRKLTQFVQIKQMQDKAIDLKIIQNIIQDFNKSWNKKIDFIKNQIYKRFGKNQLSSTIISKFAKYFVKNYGILYTCVKINSPQFLTKLKLAHSIMSQLNQKFQKVNDI